MNEKPLLGITMGDPAGIGPEVVIRAVADPQCRGLCRSIVVGDLGVMKDAAKITAVDLPMAGVECVGDADFDPEYIYVLDQKSVPSGGLVRGKVGTVAGDAAYRAVETVIRLALDKKIDGTVTAPINKMALRKAGYPFAGHTEIYAELTGTRDYTMMLAEGASRVTHVSTHLSLREACTRVKKDRITRVIRLSHQACRDLGIHRPRIVVAGLNPHAGEDGLFGTEEIEEIIPAIEECRNDGMDIAGPLPPDTLFPKLRSGRFDIAVAMYHDQGHIPMKVFGFDFTDDVGGTTIRGVNVTLGLPIIRSSVDHGTAFDIAWKGIADPGSMIEAIAYGARLAKP